LIKAASSPAGATLASGNELALRNGFGIMGSMQAEGLSLSGIADILSAGKSGK